MLGMRLAQWTIRTTVHTPVYTQIPSRALVAVTGTNATQFLNGILSNQLPPEGGIYSSLLHAQGRVLYDLFVYPLKKESEKDSGYLIEHDSRSSPAPHLLDILKRYILRSKVKVRDVSSEWSVWAAWGNPPPDSEPERCWHWAASQAIESNWKTTHSPWETGYSLRIHDRRVDGMGFREVVRQGDKPHFASNYDLVMAGQYVLHRIKHGVPEGIEEIVPMQAFPMESNLDFMGAIDFRKGCYVGQELTVRTYHTGLVRKRTIPIQLYPANTSAPSKFESRTSVPNPVSGTNIQIVPLQMVMDRPLRVRGNGKLLAAYQGVGLALLRSEQVEAVINGQADFQIEPATTGAVFALKVQPWWPDMWPSSPEVGESKRNAT